MRGERAAGGQQRAPGVGKLRRRHFRQVELLLHLLVVPAADPPPGGHVRAHHLALEPAGVLHPGQLRLPHEGEGGAAGTAVILVLLRERRERDKLHAVQGAPLRPHIRQEVRLRAVHAHLLPGGGHHSVRSDPAVPAEKLRKSLTGFPLVCLKFSVSVCLVIVFCMRFVEKQKAYKDIFVFIISEKTLSINVKKGVHDYSNSDN